MNTRHPRGSTFSLVLIVLVVLAIVVGGGVYYFFTHRFIENLPLDALKAPVQESTQVPLNFGKNKVVTSEAGRPVVVYTEEIKNTDANGRGWPTLRIWKKAGDTAPVMLADNVGKVGEYPGSFMLTPDKKSLLVNLESKLQSLDLTTGVMKDLFTAKKEVGSFIFTDNGAKLLVWDKKYASEDNQYYLEEYDFSQNSLKVLQQGKETERGEFFIEKKRDDNKILLMESLGEASLAWYMDLTTGALQQVPGDSSISQMFSSTGKYIAVPQDFVDDACNDFSGSAFGTFALLDPITGTRVRSFGEQGKVINIIEFSPKDDEILYESYAPVKAIPGEDYDQKTARCKKFQPVKSYFKGSIKSGSVTPVSDYQSVVSFWNDPHAYFDVKYEPIDAAGNVQEVVYYRGKKVFEASPKTSAVTTYVEYSWQE